MTDDHWLQASLPVKDGGLGVRSVVSLASSAFLASAATTDELQGLILTRTNITADTSRDRSLHTWTNTHSAPPPQGQTAFAQRNWDACSISEVKKKIFDNCQTEQERARVLASQAPHAGDWLNAFPITSCGLRMSDDTIKVAVGLRLGARLCEPHKCPCGDTVDAFGLHSLSCRRSAGRHTRHNMVNDIVWRALAKAKIPSIKEPAGLYRKDNKQANKRPDGLTLVHWKGGKSLLWDATIPDTCAISHVSRTSRFAGAAAEHAAEAKMEKYKHLDKTHIIIPLAIETLGPINSSGSDFLSILGNKIEEITEDTQETKYLFQRLSVAIQQGNAISFQGCFEELTPSCG